MSKNIDFGTWTEDEVIQLIMKAAIELPDDALGDVIGELEKLLN